MNTRPDDPFAPLMAAVANLGHAFDSIAAAVKVAGESIARMFRITSPLDSTVVLAELRLKAGGNGYVVGGDWVCASCMGWLCDSCAGLGCSCTTRAHAA